jgi:hypothetical protein
MRLKDNEGRQIKYIVKLSIMIKIVTLLLDISSNISAAILLRVVFVLVIQNNIYGNEPQYKIV